MNKFKIEKGISRITRVKLQAAIEESIADDIALLCEWSNNEKNYVVNELLRFALSQDADFQAHKESRTRQNPDRSGDLTAATKQPEKSANRNTSTLSASDAGIGK